MRLNVKKNKIMLSKLIYAELQDYEPKYEKIL